MKIFSIKLAAFLFAVGMLYSLAFSYLDGRPPIPSEKMDLTAELKYIFTTDNAERLDTTNTMLYSTFIKNDSIRLTRVIELDTSGMICTELQKYYAAFIYHHAGGSLMKDDIRYHARAVALYDEIIESQTTEILSDTLSLKEISQNNLFRLFKKEIYDHADIDTLVASDNDTLLIVNTLLIERAKSFRELAEAYLEAATEDAFGVESQERIDRTVRVDNFGTPEGKASAKAQIRKNIIESLEEKYPSMLKNMSKEQIDALVDEQFQSLQNLINSAIKDVQENPEKFKTKEEPTI